MALVEPRPRRGSLSHFHVRALGHASLIGRCYGLGLKMFSKAACCASSVWPSVLTRV